MKQMQQWQSSPRMRVYGNCEMVLSLSQILASGPGQLRPKEVKIKEPCLVVCRILCDYGHSKSSFYWKTQGCAPCWKTSLFKAHNSSMQKLNDWEKETDVPFVV